MLEIKPQMRPAVAGKPAKVIGYQVIVDGYDVHWQEAVHCWLPDGNSRTITASDFRKFATIFNDIADTLEAQEKSNHHG